MLLFTIVLAPSSSPIPIHSQQQSHNRVCIHLVVGTLPAHLIRSPLKLPVCVTLIRVSIVPKKKFRLHITFIYHTHMHTFFENFEKFASTVISFLSIIKIHTIRFFFWLR